MKVFDFSLFLHDKFSCTIRKYLLLTCVLSKTKFFGLDVSYTRGCLRDLRHVFSSEKKELLWQYQTQDCWFPAAILYWYTKTHILMQKSYWCTKSYWCNTKLYKGVWNVSANNSETMGHKDRRLGKIVYILVFYNISFSWLLPLDGVQFSFLLRDSENDLQSTPGNSKPSITQISR